MKLTAVLLVCLGLLAGCAAPTPRSPAPKEFVFYPSAPDLPRIQHLATFARASDLGGPRSALADFVLGGEKVGAELRRPYGTSIFEGRIYVTDNQIPGLVIFDLVSKQFSIVSGTGAGKMQRPINVTIEPDGTKYVTDTARGQVLVFDRADQFVRALGVKDEMKPTDSAVFGERLYVVDIGHHEVRALDKRTGKLLFRFDGAESGAGKLFQPTNLVIGGDGDVYVVETGNFRVSRFTSEGKFVRVYGEAGQGPGQFARPKGIALDRAGRLYVGDAAFQNVQVFDNGGRMLMAFGQPPGGAQGLNLPAGVSIDYDNVALFRSYADPKFAIEYLILVVSQFGPNQVDVFGFGRMSDMAYPPEGVSAAAPDPKPKR